MAMFALAAFVVAILWTVLYVFALVDGASTTTTTTTVRTRLDVRSRRR